MCLKHQGVILESGFVISDRDFKMNVVDFIPDIGNAVKLNKRVAAGASVINDQRGRDDDDDEGRTRGLRERPKKRSPKKKSPKKSPKKSGKRALALRSPDAARGVQAPGSDSDSDVSWVAPHPPKKTKGGGGGVEDISFTT